MMRAAPAGAVPAVVAGAAARAVWRHRGRIPGLREQTRWVRVNHRQRTVHLGEGVAWAAGAAAGLACAPGLGGRHRAGALAGLAGAATFGVIDDLGDRHSAKGIHGHVGALARGEVTTGLLKVFGIGAAAFGASQLVDRRAGLADTVIGTGIVAGAANFANLLDLRPGRAIKAGLAAAGLLAAAHPGDRQTLAGAGAAAGASLALLGTDLAEEGMLGDAGANALGAVLGVTAIVAMRPAPAARAPRAATLALLTAAILASEKVSFTAVIESTPVLRELDAWGRN